MSACTEANTGTIIRLTVEGSLLRKVFNNMWRSRNGRFTALRAKANGYWTVTDRRNGKVYGKRTDKLFGHQDEIRSLVRFECAHADDVYLT